MNNENANWTDGINGTPYAFTSFPEAKAVKEEMNAGGIPCRTLRVESYCYHLERKSDGLMLSQEGWVNRETFEQRVKRVMASEFAHCAAGRMAE